MDGSSREYDWLGLEPEAKLLEVETKSNYFPHFSQVNIFLHRRDLRSHGICFLSGHSDEGVTNSCS